LELVFQIIFILNTLNQQIVQVVDGFSNNILC